MQHRFFIPSPYGRGLGRGDGAVYKAVAAFIFCLTSSLSPALSRRERGQVVFGLLVLLVLMTPLRVSANTYPTFQASIQIPDYIECTVEDKWICRDVFNRCLEPQPDEYNVANVDEMLAVPCELPRGDVLAMVAEKK